ncbi:hypothetical protein K2P47_02860 [Patescibacteria group bacterium]|nr:hypothetical protein [Patescibacteria group bacterium]
MGVWWQDVSVRVPKQVVRFEGDTSAISKRLPVFWRFGQDWHCLSVSGDYESGYRLYFSTGHHQMSHRALIRARFVMVREGREPVVFWAEDEYGKQLELLKTGRMVPAHWHRPDRSSPDATRMSLLKEMGDITWV